jgi:histidinol-phosphate aminotransferase
MPEEKRSTSRRTFLGFAGLGMAWTGISSPSRNLEITANRVWEAATDPSLRASVAATNFPVHIDSNENPYGPSEKAIAAIKSSCSQAGRYVHNPGELHRALCQHNKVEPSMIEVGYGSSEILKMAAEAFLGPGKNVIVAQPSYESISRYGDVYGAQTVRVPLDTGYRHDLKKMRAAVNDKTGLVYICNPNNPTATVVSEDEMKDFLAAMPAEIPVLIDEAYHHYVADRSYASSIQFAKAGKAVIVSRTFSKIYGMAGLRLGYAMGREDLIGKMSNYKLWLNMNALTMAAALASLDDQEFVGRNQKLNTETRHFVEGEVTALGLRCIPSQANFVMIDLKRQAYPVLGSLRSRNVFVGRLFPPLMNHMRVTLGTAEEMKRFVEELKQVLS